MIVPAWLTVHVIGYGLAVGVIGGAGVYALHEHDSKIRAEDKAQAALDADTLRTRLMQAAIDAKSAQVDTVIVATRTIIQPTKVLIDSATKHVTDTTLVKAALAKADTANKVCLLLAQTCDEFKKMATDSMRVMGILLRQSDQRAKQAFAPPPAPRLSVGIQAGVGYCVPLTPPYSGKPCVSATIGGSLRIF
jgi:transcriptional regulator of nitric oxide reductase